MKKQYQSPLMRELKMENTDIVTASQTPIQNGNGAAAGAPVRVGTPQFD